MLDVLVIFTPAWASLDGGRLWLPAIVVEAAATITLFVLLLRARRYRRPTARWIVTFLLAAIAAPPLQSLHERRCPPYLCRGSSRNEQLSH